MEVIMIEQEEGKILYLSRGNVELACHDLDGVGIVRELFRLHAAGETILPDEAYLAWVNSEGESVRSLNMPGYVGGKLEMAGTKIINANIANFKRGLPRASGITLLYDNVSARVVCMMESAYISSFRTACVTASAANVFQGRDIEHIALIGAGVLARMHIEVLLKALPHIGNISVYDLAQERVTALRTSVMPLLEEYGVAFDIMSTAEEAVRLAQLIVPVTTTTVGYIPFAWLQPGTIVVNVSLDDVLPDVVLLADKVFVDDWKLVKHDSRRLLGKMYRSGEIIGPDEAGKNIHGKRRSIDGTLGEIVLGTKVGRNHSDQIILFNPFGLAIEDVAFATHVYQVARKEGLGVSLER